MAEFSSFEWDEAKNQQNLRKHNLPFEIAQLAFADPQRIIAKDLEHSSDEERFYCFGKVEKDIVTDALLIGTKKLELLAQATGERVNRYMKKKIKYSDEKIGEVKVVKDFLPKPEELVFKDNTVKVTLNLSKSSIDFFKALACKHGSQYQKVIRNLLDSYTSHYNG